MAQIRICSRIYHITLSANFLCPSGLSTDCHSAFEWMYKRTRMGNISSKMNSKRNKIAGIYRW